ncbi:MAG: alpha/beta fold hydrolase [Gemmataceae bacterium]|nr:alpha/beta fold hydrolase [Gemmataceae bacterium]
MPITILGPAHHLAWEEWGPADAPAVILLHPLGADHRAWLPAVVALQDDYRLVTPDLPGHGRSSMPAEAGPAEIGTIADAVAAAIEEAEAGLSVLAGAGLGAAVALELAAKRPESAAGLALVDLTAGGDGESPDTGLAQMRKLGPQGVARQKAAAVRDPFIAGAVRDQYRRIGAEGYLTAAAALRAWRPPDPAPIRHLPTLLVAGEDAPGRSAAEELTDGFEALRTVLLRGVAGAALNEAPEFVAAAIRAFLFDVERGMPVAGHSLH